MKKTVKIISTLLIVLTILTTMANIVLAISPASVSPNDANTSSIQIIGNNVIGIIQTIGVIISVGILVVLGIKYMMGSAEEKAEYKKTMIPYIIGAVLIFAATQIATAIYTFAHGISAN